MNNPDTEFLFPMRAIGALAEMRGKDWGKLVKKLDNLPQTDEAKIAFSLLMIKLAGCVGCTADSFRAMRGCTQCARLVIKRYKGTDDELIELYTASIKDVKAIMEKRNSTLFSQDK
jgi:hypothetical protein